VSTIVPKGEDGDLDLDTLKGLKVRMTTDEAPQSGRPTLVKLTPAQHKKLESLTCIQGEHQELCKRVYKRVEVRGRRILTLILSTDMALIQGALNRGDKGDWQDLFGEIFSVGPSVSRQTPGSVENQPSGDVPG
jgi:hypothetical protein